MTIHDRIYGDFTIDSPVLLELLTAPTVLRLKKISQLGVPDEYYYIKGYSRYEHSVGVMLLLKKLGATEEEQITGLLHDASHTAFSHVIDWVVGSNGTESHQDDHHEEYLMKSEIPAILMHHGFDPARIARHTTFRLLDREIPDLCADRVDYSLRQFAVRDVAALVPAITAHEGRIILNDRASAARFARLFLDKQINDWAGFESASRYHLLAEALKRALAIGVIAFDDMWTDDEQVMQKLVGSTDPLINRVLTALRKPTLTSMALSLKAYEKKFRYVDPEFRENNRIIRLSAVDDEFNRMIEETRRKNADGIRVAIV